MDITDTIIALATPNGTSALAIIRMCGSQSDHIASLCIEEKERFLTTKPLLIKRYTFIKPVSGEIIDDVTMIKYTANSSSHGEFGVEIFCHGGKIVVEEIINSLVLAGARCAMPGEFSRRAFCNGKIDLLQAESIAQIIESRTSTQKQQAMFSYSGKATQQILEWKRLIVECVAELEAQIEFPEEEDVIEKSSVEMISQKLRILQQRIHKEIEHREQIKRICAEKQVAIIGPANAGKSTLFNHILDFNRAIVHEKSGTTRDSISENIVLCGHDVSLVDTAGLEVTDNEIEQMGIDRTKEIIKTASLLIWVTSAEKKLSVSEKEILCTVDQNRVICIINKIDLAPGSQKAMEFKEYHIPHIEVSIKEEIGVEGIRDFISEKLNDINSSAVEPSVFGNERQYSIGRNLLVKIEEGLSLFGVGIEISVESFKRAISEIDELLGSQVDNEVLNEIFSKFCVGK